MGLVDTRNILFICGVVAFDGIKSPTQSDLKTNAIGLK